MAETVIRNRPQGATLVAGPPNLQRQWVLDTALRMLEQRWQQMERPEEELEPQEFASSVEWANTTRLRFSVTGFDFAGDPEIRRSVNGRATPDDTVVNVAASLAEPEAQVDERRVPVFEDIHWDELEDSREQPPFSIQPLATALELYEPPVEAAVQEASKDEGQAAIEVQPEEEVIVPDMMDRLLGDLPKLRRPPVIQPQAAVQPVTTTGSRLHLPTVSVLPLRQPMCKGPSPEAPAPAETEAAAAPQIKPEEPPKAEAKATPSPEPKREPERVAKVEPAAKPEPVAKAEPAAKLEPAVQAEPVAKAEPPKIEQVKTEHAKAEPAPSGKTKQESKKNRKHHRQTHRQHDGEEPIEEPSALGEEVEAELAAIAARTQDGKAPATKTEEKKPQPEASKKASPAGQPDDAPRLGLATEFPLAGGLTNGSGAGVRIGIAAGVLAVIGGLAAWQFSGVPRPKAPAGPLTGIGVGVVETAGIVMGDAGWQTDWATDTAGNKFRQLSFYRPSMHISDYRVEFQAEIESKAVSWLVRAASASRYYVLKLQQVKGGPSLVVNLARFPVVDNIPGETVEKQLPFPVHLGMVYRVRQDVIGPKFSVTIQDHTVDEWMDASILTGGFGVANEGADRGQVRQIQVWHLRQKSAK
ncbi:MAG: hypothetical protein HY235_06470 [Acidobacteria bacterium]|nr:hypothetical protein [Acidobacteriota bacterium]